MRIDLFRMERTQCLYENEVEFNLSESGVLPLRVEEILEGEYALYFIQSGSAFFKFIRKPGQINSLVTWKFLTESVP